jgi:hypothetical protein
MVISQELRALERTSEDITATPNRKKIAALFQCQFYQANKEVKTNKRNNWNDNKITIELKIKPHLWVSVVTSAIMVQIIAAATTTPPPSSHANEDNQTARKGKISENHSITPQIAMFRTKPGMLRQIVGFRP